MIMYMKLIKKINGVLVLVNLPKDFNKLVLLTPQKHLKVVPIPIIY